MRQCRSVGTLSARLLAFLFDGERRVSMKLVVALFTVVTVGVFALAGFSASGDNSGNSGKSPLARRVTVLEKKLKELRLDLGSVSYRVGQLESDRFTQAEVIDRLSARVVKLEIVVFHQGNP
jgi:hypothetical protein